MLEKDILLIINPNASKGRGKKKAQELFRAWTRKGLFTPGVFRKQSTLETVTGLYVPFWLYDLGVNVRMQADGVVRAIYAPSQPGTYLRSSSMALA